MNYAHRYHVVKLGRPGDRYYHLVDGHTNATVVVYKGDGAEEKAMAEALEQNLWEAHRVEVLAQPVVRCQ